MKSFLEEGIFGGKEVVRICPNLLEKCVFGVRGVGVLDMGCFNHSQSIKLDSDQFAFFQAYCSSGESIVELLCNYCSKR